ncbi:hypothetical protein FHW67_003070 [Herbaspirillum sp. Sphag1AN]|uniref:hypothetical protein n=1 Tax=unclassified Herbaspirillum TaxID=2624150 RepID=UPI00160BB40F|nr:MULTISPECIES: hypothetical protein [unclassified Herbaspirillum]MBB3213769.1 hypothetical protein [Herbaspirillum sp. Sphag1AN]MBB3246966.1 hypothetical protein [Herbaspirillum sp. Sphag64]
MGGLFIGTSKHLLALMNSAPAELLHPLTYAALQLSWWHLFALAWTSDSVINNHNKRHQQHQNSTTKKNASGIIASVRNTLPEKPSGFSKEKPPDPTISGKAAITEKIAEKNDSVFYCSLNLATAFPFLAV